MNKKKRPAIWLEGRRMRALELKGKGWRQGEIAEALGVTAGAVSQWIKLWKSEGRDALAARPKVGAPSRLSQAQKNQIPELLWHGAEAYGFRGNIWTCARVAHVIKEEFNVTYEKSHVSRILKELRWTPHKPVIRALQRDELEIERWRDQGWPALKKKRNERKEP